MQQRLLREVGGIVAAFIAWWAVAVLLGMVIFALWPPGGSFTAGISLEPQHIPGNALGFVLALYAFRAVTRLKSQPGAEQPERRPRGQDRRSGSLPKQAADLPFTTPSGLAPKR